MAKGQQSPRQKMINLMYLVFIAMLAMNVDREVLRSFEDVNNSFDQSIELTEQNNQTFYKQISNKAEEDADYSETLTKAQSLKRDVDNFVSYVDGLKTDLVSELEYSLTGPEEGEEANYNALQNTEAITGLFFKKEAGGLKESGNAKADEFVANINILKAKFAAAGVSKARLDKVFNTQTEEKRKTWVQDKFYEQPMIAALTNLTKIQSDARTEEGNAIRNLLQGKLEDKIEFTTTALLVDVPDVIKEGTQSDAFIAIGAYNDEASGAITINGKSYPLSAGKATVPLNKTAGDYTLAGTVKYKLPNGQEKEETINEKYSVVSETLEKAPTGGSISADKMNVVYKGVSNPLTATINGADGPISMSASTGSLSGSNGKYTYKTTGGSKVVFTASAKSSTGKTITEKKEFRIKPVPPPQGQIRGKNALTLPLSSLGKVTVSAAIPDFEFPVTFNVTGFKLKVPGQKTVTVKGNSLKGAGRVLDQVDPGDAVTVFDIQATAQGLGGARVPNISPVAIEVR